MKVNGKKIVGKIRDGNDLILKDADGDFIVIRENDHEKYWEYVAGYTGRQPVIPLTPKENISLARKMMAWIGDSKATVEA